jgi:hypothetical protein
MSSLHLIYHKFYDFHSKSVEKFIFGREMNPFLTANGRIRLTFIVGDLAESIQLSWMVLRLSIRSHICVK